MRIAVWKTGHEIADTVADAVYAGFCKSECNAFPPFDTRLGLHHVDDFDCHIGYGILRGMSDVFRECDRQRKPWFNIDKGYFTPGHYDGNYRVSLRGTQQTFGFPNPVGVKAEVPQGIGHVLICPPTEYVSSFFHILEWRWRRERGDVYIVRHKGDPTPLEQHLYGCKKVITFNSSVAWKALELGIPVESDPTHSIVGAYQKVIDFPLHLQGNYRQLFAFMREMQMTLSEMRDGKLWALLQRQLGFLSDMTAEKPLHPMSPPTAFVSAQSSHTA